MPMMKSPAGDLEISISKITAENNRLVTVGKFGTWDSTIYFTVDEVFELAKFMFNRPVIHFIIKLPVLFVKSRIMGTGKG